MLEKKFSTRFKKDLKKYSHKKNIIQEFNEVLKLLLSNSKPPRNITTIHFPEIMRRIGNAT